DDRGPGGGDPTGAGGPRRAGPGDDGDLVARPAGHDAGGDRLRVPDAVGAVADLAPQRPRAAGRRARGGTVGARPGPHPGPAGRADAVLRRRDARLALRVRGGPDVCRVWADVPGEQGSLAWPPPAYPWPRTRPAGWPSSSRAPWATSSTRCPC